MGEHRIFGRGRTRSLLAVGMLLGSGAVATSAYWTARSGASLGTLSAGTMVIKVNGAKTYDWSSGTPSLDLTNVAAGTKKASLITVSNNSTGPVSFTYQVNAAGSGALASSLSVQVWSGGAITGGGTSGATCAAGTGTQLTGSGTVAGAGGMTFNGVAALAAASSVTLCVEVDVASDATAGTSTPLTFTFPAKQVFP